MRSDPSWCCKLSIMRVRSQIHVAAIFKLVKSICSRQDYTDTPFFGAGIFHHLLFISKAQISSNGPSLQFRPQLNTRIVFEALQNTFLWSIKTWFCAWLSPISWRELKLWVRLLTGRDRRWSALRVEYVPECGFEFISYERLTRQFFPNQIWVVIISVLGQAY